MRTLLIISALTLMPFLTWADLAPRVAGKALLCELVDLSRSRILERRQALINPKSSKAILMLMGGNSDVTGTVRDFPGSDSVSRRLEITLQGTHGFGGHSFSRVSYRLDQAVTNQSLGEAQLSGDFTELLLRCFLRNAPAVI